MRVVLTVSAAVLVVALVGAAIWLYTPDKPRAELEAKYAGPTSQFLDALGLRLHVRDTGPNTAPALVLLHGFAGNIHTWDSWAPALEADHRVIRFDLPGFGLTGADPTDDYTDERSIAVIVALMDRLGVPHAIIVGHSMGGRIAWRFAAAHPERTEKLVLMAPDGYASPGRPYGAAPSVPFVARLLPYTLPRFLFRATLAPAYVNTAAMTEDVVTLYRDMLLAPGVRRAILARMAQDRLVPPDPILAGIQVPTLLLWGEGDRLVPFSNSAEYLRALPHAALVRFPGVGHIIMDEAPGPSLAALRAFIDAPAGSGRNATAP